MFNDFHLGAELLRSCQAAEEALQAPLPVVQVHGFPRNIWLCVNLRVIAIVIVGVPKSFPFLRGPIILISMFHFPNVKGEAGWQRAHGPARRAHALAGPSRAGEF